MKMWAKVNMNQKDKMYYLSHVGMWRQGDLEFDEYLDYTVRLYPKVKATTEGSLERL